MVSFSMIMFQKLADSSANQSSLRPNLKGREINGCQYIPMGFLDEDLGVDWAERGDLSLHDILEECRDSGRLADIVAGSSPGWNAPWSRAIRVKVVSFDYTTITVESGETSAIYRDEVQAIRLAPQSESLGKDKL